MLFFVLRTGYGKSFTVYAGADPACVGLVWSGYFTMRSAIFRPLFVGTCRKERFLLGAMA
jgi:hypothetical protein